MPTRRVTNVAGRVLALAVLLLVVGAIALLLSTRPKLEDAQDTATTEWDALAPALDARYELLAEVTAAVATTSGPAAAIAGDADDALEQWTALRAQEASVADLVAAANALEALGRRLDAAVRSSPQLSGNADVVAAIDAFTTAPVPEGVESFNAAVREYADERSGPLRGPIADALGYDAIPTLDA